jgi:indole-3-glycerol phosphate synthase
MNLEPLAQTVYLLIASCLDDEELKDLSDLATSLGMDTLVEVHDRVRA